MNRTPLVIQGIILSNKWGAVPFANMRPVSPPNARGGTAAGQVLRPACHRFRGFPGLRQGHDRGRSTLTAAAPCGSFNRPLLLHIPPRECAWIVHKLASGTDRPCIANDQIAAIEHWFCGPVFSGDADLAAYRMFLP